MMGNLKLLTKRNDVEQPYAPTAPDAQNPNERVFTLHGDIEDNNIGQVIDGISKIIITDEINEMTYRNYMRLPIKLYIQSYGGSVYDALALVDIILTSPTPVHTICTGYAMSAAFIIFIVGHVRFVTKHATLLYHQISSAEWGKLKDLEENIEETKRLQKVLEDIVLEHTLISKKELEESYRLKKDMYYDAKDCINKGIADFYSIPIITREKVKAKPEKKKKHNKEEENTEEVDGK
jgi:ATP-dependent Clp protease protease subunit